MQNEKTNKQKQTISFLNLPSIIVVVIFIVGIGAVFGLLGYLVSGIKENITPVVQKPSVKITDKTADNYFGNKFIQVKSPQKNATIKNPILISGKANVDEANVRVKITDDNENILADTFITADGWMDKLYPFEKEIDYKTPQTENGLIEIFEESAKDGSEIYKIEVPVIFEDYGDEISDWKIYRNEEYGFEMKYPKDISVYDPSLKNGEAELYISAEKMDDIEDFPSGFTKKNAFKDKFALEKGNPLVPFSWGITDSYKIVNIPEALGKEFIVLQAFEVCDVQFTKEAFIYKNDYRIRLTWRNSYEKVKEITENNPSYFTLDAANCGNYKAWKDNSSFYKDLVAGKTDSVSQKWISDFSQILSTFKFIEK